MKILVGCLNANGLGGSEMYHYELVRELSALQHDVTLFSLRDINPFDQVRIKLSTLGIKQVDTKTLDTKENFDILVLSQPEVNVYMLNIFKNTPCISIIHSEIRSEDPVLDSKISHYIVIRNSIKDLLISSYGINKDKISLIYNPIDQTRFNPIGAKQYEKITGIFIGGALDPIRNRALQHIAYQCIENDWDLKIMSDYQHDFNHPNITYLKSRWDTEHIVKNCHFTAGILMGRTTLEGWCCNIPAYMYKINKHGDILGIETEMPENIIKLCDSKYVVNEHLKLYEKVINEYK